MKQNKTKTNVASVESLAKWNLIKAAVPGVLERAGEVGCHGRELVLGEQQLGGSEGGREGGRW